MAAIGIDIGGTGIKGALVDLELGQRTSARLKLVTPPSRQPEPVLDAVVKLIQRLRALQPEAPRDQPIGVGFPAVVVQGRPRTPFTSHQETAWVGYPVAETLERRCGAPIVLLNDADAAGLAEARFGAGRLQPEGLVLMLTLGTGIGSALILDGKLVPNTELGHLYLRDHHNVVEAWASERTRKDLKLGWKAWAARLNEVLVHLERLFTPQLIVLGGGVAKHHERFIPRLKLNAPVVPAQLLNDAGLVGAALATQGWQRPTAD